MEFLCVLATLNLLISKERRTSRCPTSSKLSKLKEEHHQHWEFASFEIYIQREIHDLVNSRIQVPPSFLVFSELSDEM